MIPAIRRGSAALLLCLVASAAIAEDAPAPPAEPPPRDIERVIETLEDPEARAELVSELRVLLEAEQNAAAADEPLPAAGDVLQALRQMLAEAWQTITSIEPRQLLLSIGASAVIIVAALVIRALALRLVRLLYRRLSSGGRVPAEDVIDLAEADTAGADAAGVDAAGAERPVEAGGRFPAAITRLINLIVGVLAAALIAESWGAELGELFETDLGSRVLEASLAIGLILLITVIAWHVAGLLVARLLTLSTSVHDPDRERSGRRLQTLVPLLRALLQGFIGVLAALLILSELGVDIAPLLAGAGILGLAIGFGAQTLVKDLISGVTILLEDSATVGDVVEVAGHSGVVEEMRVRFIRLRDLAGAVRFVPYSEVTSIINYTKDFAYYLIQLQVAYREDTDEVVGVLGEVTETLRGDAEFRPKILEPLEVLGVDQFESSGVLIKARIKTQPGAQWSIGREFNRRLKKVFDERGIEIPFPHTTVYFGEAKDGRAAPARLSIVDAPGDLLASRESSS